MWENFRYDFRDSIYNPAFYETQSERPLRSSFAYFIVLGTILAIVTGAVLTAEFFPVYRSFAARDAAAQYVPAGFSLTIKGGVASSTLSGQSEPFSFPMPAMLKSASSPSHLLVIDTKEDHGDAALLASLDAFSVLTRHSIVMSGNGFAQKPGSVQTADFSGIPDMTINRGLASALDRWLLAHPIEVSAAFFLAMFVKLFLTALAYLVSCVFFAFAVLVVAYFFGRALRYRAAYLSAVHSFTLPLLANSFFLIAGLAVPFWLWGPTLSLMVLAMNWRPERAAESDEDKEEEDPNPYR